jgi:hypothetical protein
MLSVLGMHRKGEIIRGTDVEEYEADIPEMGMRLAVIRRWG